ncbi:uncharacterized protein L969DRAFT_84417 [Mixia osmundae IAM 14324]|uniref:NADPH--cytochrome P450 reductase n=1 Tax=Mixia osmundae (strain CBS 9802 / IAM 14324 / JCM 22182 / KY 12970) TaxID=764103 RepID=G7E2Y0_MIXOS|nr:uncharacterized protein L969DRAFT_84417 [Mixia osmundae IAM 14324]KEI42551.1 hypothetical protein L969DRAFT_84417 [Mixia osmundae IAM 14324]GAA97161.1 hypothetical protein E5Q_03837 [Mixia osmundae IAM 14324]
MLSLSTSDLILLAIVGLGAIWYLFGTGITNSAVVKPPATNGLHNGNGKLNGDPPTRNFVEAMQKANKKICIFYGSQTGTAEDYALRIAKEAKSRFGLSSLVCDPEDYDFDMLDTVPEDHLIVFAVATYGEGEPTDNAVQLMDFIKDESITFSNGSDRLDNLHYVVFSLGNRTYEQFNAVGRTLDSRLASLGAKRVGERGEGDDDKSMEEDYLAWKDDMWKSVTEVMGYQEGSGGDTADFEVKELGQDIHDKVYAGELSARALNGTRGVHDAKNPCLANLVSCKELFMAGDRNCIFAEFDIKDTGMRYQAGDHLGLWPMSPDPEVERMLKVLGLVEKAQTVVEITSLDPALAKVPFPTPTTYDAIFRHYLDVCALVGRQTIAAAAKYAPTPEAQQYLERLGSDKAAYQSEVVDNCYKLAQVLIVATGGNPHADPATAHYTPWSIPAERVITYLPRLQPRYYSISSSPRYTADLVHITAVVTKDQAGRDASKGSYVYGVTTNYLLNAKLKTHEQSERLDMQNDSLGRVRGSDAPSYRLDGPRGKLRQDSGGYKMPIHIRRSNFRLPTSPKVPVVMIGPGTGVAPFRGFLQDRLALARKAKAKDGEGALADWADMVLYYGCRRKDQDYLYESEWKEYAAELDGKFTIQTAFSREPGQPKQYVQQLIRAQKDHIKSLLVDKKGYVYICGDAKNMAREVEEVLKELLGEATGEPGEKAYKTMKDRNRILLDVWS